MKTPGAGPDSALVAAARRLRRGADALRFAPPVGGVYDPLRYAGAVYEAYLRRFAASPKRTVFLGMNPGPWGMAQTGVPFGEVAAVRDWMGLEGPVARPASTHPRLPVLGFGCTRSEVSGRRLWGLMRERFGDPASFFREHLVMNYCPLLFLDGAGRNLTPDRLRREDRDRLFPLCDAHLAAVVEALRPAWLVGVGGFAEARIREAAEAGGWTGVRVARIPHPSPASPAANRDWAGLATRALEESGVWKA